MRSVARSFAASLALASLAGCAAHNPKMWEPPKLMRASPVKDRLAVLPPPGQRIAVAVYGFTDQTGQFKPSDTVQTLSRAVTQGATSVLVKTLQDTGNKNWFQVIERERLDNVLRERAVIREMRATYLGEKQLNRNALPPLLFAGVLLEGGIIGYDSNTKTGGAGARFLGIGGSTQYREDTVTIYLRAVSVKTGEVLSSVSVRKSIAAVSIGGNAFRFVDFKELLELEAGIAYNEPDQIALTQAIEKAVYALIMEGALNDLWCFRSNGTGQEQTLLTEYLAERDNIDEKNVRMPLARNGQTLNTACAQASASSNISSPQLTPMAFTPTVVPQPRPQPAIVQPMQPTVSAPVANAGVAASTNTAPNTPAITVRMPVLAKVPSPSHEAPTTPAKEQAKVVQPVQHMAPPQPQPSAQLQTVKEPVAAVAAAPKATVSVSAPAKAIQTVVVPSSAKPKIGEQPPVTAQTDAKPQTTPPKSASAAAASPEPVDTKGPESNSEETENPPLSTFITAMLMHKGPQSNISPQPEKETVPMQ